MSFKFSAHLLRNGHHVLVEGRDDNGAIGDDDDGAQGEVDKVEEVKDQGGVHVHA